MSNTNNISKKNVFKNKLEVEPEKKKKKNDSKKSFDGWNKIFANEKSLKVIGVFLILFALFLTFSFISFFTTWWMDYDKISHAGLRDILFNNSIETTNMSGRLGAALSHIFIKKWFGVASFIFIFLFFITGLKLLKINLLKLSKAYGFSFFILIFASVGFAYIFKNSNYIILGGEFGYETSSFLEGLLGKIGAGILLVFAFLCFLIVAFNTSFRLPILSKENNDEITEDNTAVGNSYIDTPKEEDAIEEVDNELEPGSLDFEVVTKATKPAKPAQSETVIDNKNDVIFTVETPAETFINQDEDEETLLESEDEIAMVHNTIDSEYDPRLDLSTYQFPTLDLMADYNESPSAVQNDELISNKNKIIETLRNYSIEIVQIKATIGPTVTLYEIVPAPGVRISKIKNLEDDIALSLSALGIRIIAPIPGKGTIGIEVPNQNPQIVSMKTMLSSEKFQNSKMELPIAIGKTIANEPYIADLAKMPHLLMAGATGQGKSVGLNAIIASLLYKKHPAEIKFVMVDPKKVELSLFNKIERHFLAKLPDSEEAIITDTRKVVRTLNSLTIEMDQRYDLLKDAQVKNIKEYNTKFIARKLNPNDGHRFLPYIILIVDEFADLMMTAGKEVETPITRLAQLARAIGIHLIIATQRPSVNIITGTIKANFPARVAFRVISKIDSRTILDTGGADQLVGRGDMLLSTGNDLIRLQCAFIDTPEIDNIVDFIGAQRGYTSAFNLPEYLDEDSEPNKDFDPSQKDELFEDAARIIVAHQHGSTSLLQRKLKLGYNRAGRIIDQLEAAGIVGPFEGSKAREVKYKDEIALEQFLRDNR
ncbi:MAG: DNA translocase FtsK 4TM domain-containing protein [Bacteroidetes bacterium]|nr:DNA translocase FtsK 4TM domain-containing protein [Bacteroidota bacterium]